jgi:hypothetical protein
VLDAGQGVSSYDVIDDYTWSTVPTEVAEAKAGDTSERRPLPARVRASRRVGLSDYNSRNHLQVKPLALNLKSFRASNVAYKG